MYLIKYRQSKDAELYSMAKQYVADAIEHAKQNFPFGDYHHAKIGGALMQYAEVLIDGNDFEGALEATESAINIIVNLFGTEKNSDMGYAYYHKATIFYAMGDIRQATLFAQKSIDMYEEYFSSSHPKVHAMYMLIGDCCLHCNDKEKALDNYTKALESAELTFSPNSKQVAEIREMSKIRQYLSDH